MLGLVFPPDDVGDPHGDVIHYHREIISGNAVGPLQHQVVQFLVVKGDGPLIWSSQWVTPVGRVLKRTAVSGPGGRFRSRQRPSYLGFCPGPGRPGGPRPPGRAVAVIRHAGQQAVDIVLINGQALRLAIGAFVPVKAHPGQGIQDLVDERLLGPFPVGILDPQDKSSLVMSCDEPVEQGRMGPPQMEGAGEAGEKRVRTAVRLASFKTRGTTKIHGDRPGNFLYCRRVGRHRPALSGHGLTG